MATLKVTDLGLQQVISTKNGSVALKDATQEQLQALVNHVPKIKGLEKLIVEDTTEVSAPAKTGK